MKNSLKFLPLCCREVCSPVVKEICQPFEEEECVLVPREVTNQECVTVPERMCSNVERKIPREVCSPVQRQSCTPVTRKQCALECSQVPAILNKFYKKLKMLKYDYVNNLRYFIVTDSNCFSKLCLHTVNFFSLQYILTINIIFIFHIVYLNHIYY